MIKCQLSDPFNIGLSTEFFLCDILELRNNFANVRKGPVLWKYGISDKLKNSLIKPKVFGHQKWFLTLLFIIMYTMQYFWFNLINDFQWWVAS